MIYHLYHIFRIGFKEAFVYRVADVTYFIFCIAFRLFCLSIKK